MVYDPANDDESSEEGEQVPVFHRWNPGTDSDDDDDHYDDDGDGDDDYDDDDDDDGNNYSGALY